MILIVLLASILIFTVTIFQYDEQNKEYNIDRFERKEENLKRRVNIDLRNTSFPVKTENLGSIFQNLIYEISEIHNFEITLYDLQGGLIKTSIPFSFKDSLPKNLSAQKVQALLDDPNHRIFDIKEGEDESFETSYSYLNDLLDKPIAILKLEFRQDNSEQERELREFLSRLALIYFFMFLMAISLAYFLSSYITRSIKAITSKMHQTRLYHRNEKIHLDDASFELNILVEAYNNMIDQLEESAVKLAQSEREQAWREMAKQVAHEIKNPLTPMRLSVQSFERRFDADDPNIEEKVREYSNTLIQQIDVMSSIASAFSDFAKMPKQKKEKIEVIGVVKTALDIFNEDDITYNPQQEELYGNLDKTQLIRIVTNLIKNATQAVEEKINPKVEVRVFEDGEHIIIEVEDNGKGIEESVKHLIFEPKFTTKTRGMGLGLPMIKNIIEAYQGSISFVSAEGVGTTFKVKLPKT
jgi:nitrogen fixation/metabolism regulation signal transduction histidine kinase